MQYYGSTMNLGDPNMWLEACEQWITLFQDVMPTTMENLASPKHWYTFWYTIIQRGGCWPQVCRFEPRDYVFWSKQHQLCWMWLWDVSFWMCARCYLRVCHWSKFKIVKHGRVTCIIVHHIIFLLWMAKMSHPWWLPLHDFFVCCVNNLRELLLCWFVINVLEVGIWDVSCCHGKKC